MNPNEITHEIIDAAYKVHSTLGPGLLESLYESALAWELEKKGLSFTRQQPIPVIYKSTPLGTGFNADLIVEDQIIIELKSVESLSTVHKRQLLTYLKLADKRLGLLINFNVDLIKNGIARIANNLPE